MNFKKLELQHIDTLRPYFEDNPCRICDCTIGGTFMWRDYFKTEFCIEDGILFMRVDYYNHGLAFTPPRGEHNGEPYETLIAHCRNENIPVRLSCVSKSNLDFILSMYPKASYFTEPNWSDYVYNMSDLSTLAGRRYSGQRNHINKFVRDNPDWSFEKISADNTAEVREFYEKIFEAQTKDAIAFSEGNFKTLEILDDMKSWNAVCGALRAGGKIIGASVGEVSGDTLYVHTERADLSVPGAYPILVREFAAAYADGVCYINREEDDGDEGLRTSKLSYHPAMMLEKYFVEL